MDVNETLLPGVGIKYEFDLTSGTKAALVVRRDGQVDMAVYDRSDPDVGSVVLTMTAAESETVADLLGGPRIAERFADLSREIPGLLSARVVVPPQSGYAGRTLGETRVRTLTGASIVAIVRDGAVTASPAPTHGLAAGDVLIVMGTAEAIDAARRILDEPNH